MKRVLVTGASGTIGIKTIKYLLSEGKYDVTAVEIKNRKHYKALKRLEIRIFPGFPSDLQSIFGTLFTQCN